MSSVTYTGLPRNARQLLFEYFDPALMKLLRGDHAYLVLPRKIKIVLAVHLAPQSHLQKTVFPD